MAVETARDKIKLSQIVGQKQEILTVDGDVIINDVKPDVLKVINTNGTICLCKKEALNGKVKLEGCVNTYIIYLADDETGSIRTINTRYIKRDFVTMRTGGASTEGFSSRWQIMKDHLRAMKANGVYSNFFILSLRYPYKIYELFYSKIRKR